MVEGRRDAEALEGGEKWWMVESQMRLNRSSYIIPTKQLRRVGSHQNKHSLGIDPVILASMPNVPYAPLLARSSSRSIQARQ